MTKNVFYHRKTKKKISQIVLPMPKRLKAVTTCIDCSIYIINTLIRVFTSLFTPNCDIQNFESETKYYLHLGLCHVYYYYEYFFFQFSKQQKVERD